MLQVHCDSLIASTIETVIIFFLLKMILNCGFGRDISRCDCRHCSCCDVYGSLCDVNLFLICTKCYNLLLILEVTHIIFSL